MTPMLSLIKNCAILCAAALFISTPTLAVELNCSIPQMGELFINTETGVVTKGAEETLTAEMTTENSNYRFEFKGKKNQFKALINRTSGQIILDEACTPKCWGGSIFGTCSPIKAQF